MSEPTKHISERRLIRLAKRHDADAFEQLVNPYLDSLYRVALSIVGGNDEDADDALQNTLLDAWRHLNSLKWPRYFKTWLTRICINASRQIYRERSNQTKLNAKLATDPATNVSVYSDRPTEQQAEDPDSPFKLMIEAAGEACALVLDLYYGEGFSVKEIASMTDLTEENVRQRLSRGRKSVAESLRRGMGEN